MQKCYSFIMKVKISQEEAKAKRFIIKRQIVDKIRRGLGKAVSDLNAEDRSFSYLLGRHNDSDMSRVQSAAAISKWQIKFDEVTVAALKEKTTGDIEGTGTVNLLLEEENEHEDQLINQLIIMSARLNGIELKPLAVETLPIDFEILEDTQTYMIECFLPPEVKPNSLRGEENREKLKELLNHRYPLDSDPASQKRLSKYCGEAIKRHIINTAEQHGLNTETLISTIFMVKAYWIAKPVKGGKSKKNRGEACTVLFQAPLELIGNWTAGSYRHKGMGLIEKVSPAIEKQFNIGEFIL